MTLGQLDRCLIKVPQGLAWLTNLPTRQPTVMQGSAYGHAALDVRREGSNDFLVVLKLIEHQSAVRLIGVSDSYHLLLPSFAVNCGLNMSVLGRNLTAVL